MRGEKSLTARIPFHDFRSIGLTAAGGDSLLKVMAKSKGHASLVSGNPPGNLLDPGPVDLQDRGDLRRREDSLREELFDILLTPLLEPLLEPPS